MIQNTPPRRNRAAARAEKFPGYALRVQIADAFKTRRTELGMTQHAVAAEIGICVSTVRRIEQVSAPDADLCPLLAVVAWLDLALVLGPADRTRPVKPARNRKAAKTP